MKKKMGDHKAEDPPKPELKVKEEKKDKVPDHTEIKFDIERLRKGRWLTSEMTKNYERDVFLMLYARETIFYIIFVICVSIISIGAIDSQTFFMTQSLRDALKDQAGEDYPSLLETSEVTFHGISTVSGMWNFIQYHLIKYLHAGGNQDDLNQGKPFYNFTNDTFDLNSTTPSDVENVSPTKKVRKRDADPDRPIEVADNDTDRDPADEQVPPLEESGLGYENILIGRPAIRAVMVNGYECASPFPAVFRLCHPPYAADVAKTDISEGLYQYKNESETRAVAFYGRLARYRADGFMELLGPRYEDSVAVVEQLQAERFIARGTRAVFIDATFYNPSVNLFCAVKFLFELPPGGGVVPSAYFYSLRLSHQVSAMDFVVVGFKIICLLFVAFYLMQDLRTIATVKWKYFRSFWNYVNMTMIASFSAYFVIFVFQEFQIDAVMTRMRADLAGYISFQSITQTELMLRNTMAVVVFLVFFRLFKYMTFNYTMTVLNHTVEQCIVDIFAFVLMFLVMFMAFALFGTFVFGVQVHHFATISLAMFALLRVMLGDLDFEEFEDADRFIAPIYYLLFIFFVFFILLNMFLAIINDTYSDAKTDLAISPPRQRPADFWNTGVYNICRASGCRTCAPKSLVASSAENPAAGELRAALKRCGFSDLDVDLFLGRYNIDPEAEIKIKDVTKLMEQLRIQAPKRFDSKGQESQQASMVAMEAFHTHQHRLDRVEETMSEISKRLDSLMEKLNEYENERQSKL